jgi:alkylhydroperoxidase family enzyme
MTWFSPAATREEVLAILPDAGGGLSALYGALWQLSEIPPPVLELCRLRVAQLHDSPLEWQRQEVALEPDKRERLPHWHRDAAFSPAERACLAFTEVYVMDPQAITDAQADAVKAAYGEPGLVALVEALGLFYGLTRLGQLWGLPGALCREGKAS